MGYVLDVRKVYDTVWREGMWVKLWDMGVKGRMWRVIKNMYKASRSAILLEGKKSAALSAVFINGLLKDVEEAGLGIEISSGKRMGGMLLADDFVGVSESRESLQKLIDVVYRYCNRWRLKANVGKSAVMVFSKDRVEGRWK